MALFKVCKTCRLPHPLEEPHFSQYNNSGPRRYWKQVCNECIKSAAEKRIRKPAVSQVDSRDFQHPLEQVFKTWAKDERQISTD